MIALQLKLDQTLVLREHLGNFDSRRVAQVLPAHVENQQGGVLGDLIKEHVNPFVMDVDTCHRVLLGCCVGLEVLGDDVHPAVLAK